MNDVSEGVMCRRLLFATQRKGASASLVAQGPTPAPLAAFIERWNNTYPARTMAPRPAQNRFFNYLADSLSANNIGLCEAATGTGKTVAMLLAARARLGTSPTTRLLIAVPTLALMRQFADTYREMAATGLEMPALRTVVGRREFVSPDEIHAIVRDGRAGEKTA